MKIIITITSDEPLTEVKPPTFNSSNNVYVPAHCFADCIRFGSCFAYKYMNEDCEHYEKRKVDKK